MGLLPVLCYYIVTNTGQSKEPAESKLKELPGAAHQNFPYSLIGEVVGLKCLSNRHSMVLVSNLRFCMEGNSLLSLPVWITTLAEVSL